MIRYILIAFLMLGTQWSSAQDDSDPITTDTEPIEFTQTEPEPTPDDSYADPVEADAPSATTLYTQEPLEYRAVVSTETWKGVMEEFNFPVKMRKVETPQPTEQPTARAPLDWSLFSLKETTAQNIAVIVLVLIFAFIMYQVLVRNVPTVNAVIAKSDEEMLEHIEQNLHEADIDRFLRQALTAGNYRLAVRLYYLAIIKELSLQSKIEWKRDKTNGAYIREMRKYSTLLPDFQKLTLIFEYVWYSDLPFSSERYDQVQPLFRTYLQQVQTA